MSTQTLYRQTSAPAIGAPIGARSRVISRGTGLDTYRPGSALCVGGMTEAPFAKFNNNKKFRPLSPKRRRTG